MKLRIALFDAYTLALQGMHETMKSIHDFDVVGAYTDEQELLQCLKTQTVDIVVLNLMLKSSLGLELVGDVKKAQKETKIIVLTESQDELTYKRATEIGVNAMLQKDTSCSELLGVIISVGKGNNIIPDSIMQDSAHTILSEIETKVLRLVVNEYTNAQIAKELYISSRTVESHITNVCKKLEVESRIGAVKEAIRLDLV
jgi:two-component system vancomycin resistance associated response regulator VraR